LFIKVSDLMKYKHVENSETTLLYEHTLEKGDTLQFTTVIFKLS
jgi:hypothetical protein